MMDKTLAVGGRRRWLTVGLVALVLLGLGVDIALEGPPWAGGRRALWSGSSVPGHIGARFRYFDGNDDRPVTANASTDLTIRYDLEPTKGSLTLHLLSPDGTALWTRSATDPAIGSTTVSLPETGRYRVEITGDKSRGSFDVNYQVATSSAP